MITLIVENKLITMLIIAMILDILTGLIKAIKTKKLKSSTFREGGFKKFLIAIMVILSYTLDMFIFNTDILLTTVCIYFIANECISITENMGKCGVKIPKKIQDILVNLKEE